MSDEASDLAPVVKALEADGVYVAPSLVSAVPQKAQDKLVTMVEGKATPIYVVAYPIKYGDQYNGDGASLARAIVDEGGPEGVYIVGARPFDKPGNDVVAIGVDAPTTDSTYPSLASMLEEPDDLGAQLQVATELVISGKGEQRYQKLKGTSGDDSSSTTSSTTGSSPDGDGGPGAGAVGGVVLVAVLVAAGIALSRRRRRGRPGRGTFALPKSVLRRVRSASDRQISSRAQEDVLALGEAIDAHDIVASDDTTAWQAALDHYDLARRVLDRANGPADVVGAIVLASRGSDALTHAARGESWTPHKPCYLNPLHGDGTRKATWRGDGHEVDVPACAACAADLKHGRRPDLLAVTVGDRSVHYAEADVEPWSSTGYGALDPDLVTALQRRL